jgi:hypothetical protein
MVLLERDEYQILAPTYPCARVLPLGAGAFFDILHVIRGCMVALYLGSTSTFPSLLPLLLSLLLRPI